MKQAKVIDIFIDGVKAYFEQIEQESSILNIGTPYLVRSEEPLGSDYTGMIAVFGNSQGFVFFSATRPLLRYLLLVHGESDLSDRLLGDLVGEVANTISGNARREMGADFKISVPTVSQGPIKEEYLTASKRSYVMPLRWKNTTAQLIVCLNTD